MKLGSPQCLSQCCYLTFLKEKLEPSQKQHVEESGIGHPMLLAKDQDRLSVEIHQVLFHVLPFAFLDLGKMKTSSRLPLTCNEASSKQLGEWEE